MKLLILTPIIAIYCVLYCNCLDIFKTDKPTYILDLHNVALKWYDKSVSDNVTFSSRKLNRTAIGISGSARVFMDIDAFRVNIKCKEFLHNEYRDFAMSFYVSSCDIFSELYNLHKIKEHGNLTFCNMKKNEFYSVTDYTPEPHFPPNLIFGSYCLELTFYFHRKVAFILDVFYDIVPVLKKG